MLRKKLLRLIIIAGILSMRSFAMDFVTIIPSPRIVKLSLMKVDFQNFRIIQIETSEYSRDYTYAQSFLELLQERYDLGISIQRSVQTKDQHKRIIIREEDIADYVPVSGIPEGEMELLEQEGYRLLITAKEILISGSSAEGRFYGLISLLQLLQGNGLNLPAGEIIDWPALKLRGVSDDISRGQVSTMENFKRIIRFLATYKLNVYMPYLEDMIKFERYPQIGKDRGALTLEELKELQDYASRFHVEIIPIFQTLGHFENILNQSEFLPLAEFPGAASLNPQNPLTYAFLSDLLKELLPAFQSLYFHIGADESWDVGRGASKKFVQRYDLATVHARHYLKVIKMVQQAGKKVMMYGDIILRNPTILNMIPPEIIMVDWHYYPAMKYPSTELFERYNQPYIVSPGIHNWRRFYPDFDSAWMNIHYLIKNGYEHRTLGAITSSWGDYGGMNLRELNYRGYAYAAECSWNPDYDDRSLLDRRFNLLFFQKDLPEVEALNQLLISASKEVNIKKFWEAPFYPRGEELPELSQKSNRLKSTLNAALQLINQLQQDDSLNQAQLSIMENSARLLLWYAKLSEYTCYLENIRNEYIQVKERERFRDEALQRGNQLLAEISKLKKEYSQLWKTYYREDNLNLLLRLFDYHIVNLEEYLKQLKQKRWEFQQELTARFITVDTGDETKPRKIFLRKSFYLDSKRKIERAYLQLIADTHGKVWLNGKPVTEVYAIKTLSLGVEFSRVKYQEVTELLRKGKNTLAIEVTGYIPERPASANLFLELFLKNGNQETVETDLYWKGSLKADEGWQSPEYDDSYWLPVKLCGYPWRITRAYFNRGLPSRIEF